ncbi:uncharacterized protein LOC107001835 [Solanum pennellii]|uniref:Uncharacterized protein LOC107001835 n=1 Tax=Solanum pennellii TaxID=28526 RepID=A0ABM1FDB9_SOLPN|nr:uncharacterized protein LOC107001835 [Solanum pennellii]
MMQYLVLPLYGEMSTTDGNKRKCIHDNSRKKITNQANKRSKGMAPLETDIKKEVKCRFCRKNGHIMQDLSSFNNGLLKKDLRNLRKPVGSERSIYTGNKMQSHLEAIGTCI